MGMNLQRARDKGWSDDEIWAAVEEKYPVAKQARAKGLSLEQMEQHVNKQETKPGAEPSALMPQTTEAFGGDNPLPTFKEIPSTTLKMFSDVAGIPTRAMATLRKDPKTGQAYSMTQPEANIFRPEMEKVKAKIGTGQERPPETALGEAGRAVADLGTEMVGGMAGDPTTYLSILGRGLGKPLQQTAANIEQRAVHPRPSQMAKEDRDFSKVFQYDVGGTLKQSQKKIGNLFDDTEREIERVLTEGSNQGAVVDMTTAVTNVGRRILEGDPALFGNTKAAQTALDSWADELATFGKKGTVTVKEANAAKRLLGRKAWKKGGQLSADNPAKETVADMLYLELMEQVEKQAPEIRPLNQVFRDLIPIRNEIDWRVNVTDTQNPMGLMERIAGLGGAGMGYMFTQDPLQALAIGAGAATASAIPKSGIAAQALNAAGKGAGRSIPTSGLLHGVSLNLAPENAENEDEKRQMYDYIARMKSGR
jgi:hypothetical protein